MKFLRNYFSSAYQFMVDDEIRYGEEFHFPWFFLSSICLPVDLILVFVLEDVPFAVFSGFQLGVTMIISLILSFFGAFKRWLRLQFNPQRKRKRGIWEQLKRYFMLLLVVQFPILLALIRLFYLMIKEGELGNW